MYKLLLTLISSMILLSACTDVANDISDSRNKDVEVALKNYVDESLDEKEAASKIEREINDFRDNPKGKLKKWLSSQAKVTNTTYDTTDSIIDVTYDNCYDGDTCTFYTKIGDKIKVRHLLLDSSEVKDKITGKPQPFSIESKKYTNNLLSQANEIQIIFDVGEQIDKYGRSLGYILIDNELLGVKLLENGLAKIRYVNPPNTMYLEEFEKAEDIAKIKKVKISQKSKR